MSGTPPYPGPDPDSSGDPFDRPPDESGERRAAASPPPAPAPQWTPPTGSAEPEPTAPIAPEQMGYWEQKAAQEQAGPPSYTGGYAAPPSPPAPPYGGYPPGPAYGGAYYAAPQPHPRATTALVLGLVALIGGFVTCGLGLVVAPFAWVVGARSKREIDASNGQLGGRSNAQAGLVMGIIGTILLALVVVIVVGFIVLVAMSSDNYSDF